MMRIISADFFILEFIEEKSITLRGVSGKAIFSVILLI